MTWRSTPTESAQRHLPYQLLNKAKTWVKLFPLICAEHNTTVGLKFFRDVPQKLNSATLFEYPNSGFLWCILDQHTCTFSPTSPLLLSKEPFAEELDDSSPSSWVRLLQIALFSPLIFVLWSLQTGKLAVHFKGSSTSPSYTDICYFNTNKKKKIPQCVPFKWEFVHERTLIQIVVQSCSEGGTDGTDHTFQWIRRRKPSSQSFCLRCLMLYVLVCTGLRTSQLTCCSSRCWHQSGALLHVGVSFHLTVVIYQSDNVRNVSGSYCTTPRLL